jgi:Acetyltransferase (GNAT) domain
MCCFDVGSFLIFWRMINVHLYTSSQAQEWDAFVAESNNGTIFHTQKFLSYHPEGRFQFHHLMFYEGTELIAVLPAGLKAQEHALVSPMGASYGGLVLKLIPYKKNEEIVDALLKYSNTQGFKQILLTPAPLIYQSRLVQDMDYALAYKGFEIERHYISHVIDTSHKENFIEDFNERTRRYIRRCLNDESLKIEISRDLKDYADIYPILLENKKRHNATPTHSLEELCTLQKLFPEAIKLFVVRYQEKTIAASLIFSCNKQATVIFYNMLLYEFEKYRPIFLAMYEVTKWSLENGHSYVDIGVSQNPAHENPMTPSYSLVEFKEKFNAKGFLRSTYRKVL